MKQIALAKNNKYDQISSAFNLVHCLKQPHRQAIIEILHKHLGMTAADIAGRLGMETTLAHHHLGVLVQNGLVDLVSKQKASVYQLNYLKLTKVIASLKALG
ncbi:MAG: winged helix-turn-helix domain-containing protein [Bacteroidota bacterium]|jgi:DNA-binding MarR family transcriptional regulator